MEYAHRREGEMCTCMHGCAKHRYSHMCAWVGAGLHTHRSLCTRCSHVQEHALVQLRRWKVRRGPNCGPGRRELCTGEFLNVGVNLLVCVSAQGVNR